MKRQIEGSLVEKTPQVETDKDNNITINEEKGVEFVENDDENEGVVMLEEMNKYDES